MHEGELARAPDAPRLRIRLVVRIAVQVDFRSARLHGVDLDLRRSDRHDDDCPAAELLRGERDTLRMVAG